MATKELTARVKLDITDAERRLKSLTSLIKDIDRVITKSSSNKGLEQQMDRAAISAEKVKQATLRTKIAEEQLAQAKLKTNMLSEQSALKSLLAEEKLNQAINQGQQNEEKLAQIKAKSVLAEEKLAQQQVKAQQAKEAQLAKEEAWVDRVIAKEMAEVHRKQQAQWKAFQAEQAAYEKNVVQVEQRKQKELEIERVRQQSLNTMTQADRAAQRLNRTQYEQWWQAAMTRQEWAKAHPTLNRLNTIWGRINSGVQQVVSKNRLLNSAYNKISYTGSSITRKIREWAANQRTVTAATKSTSNVLNGVLSKLKGFAATYIGIMGMKAAINVSDTLTRSKNLLNNLEGGSPEQTSLTMDKAYAAAQRARTSYTELLSGASKSMTLAGDAFQGNIDNALRFEEIMAKSYKLSNSSAAEQSQSMYQLRQSLAANKFQGDELKSVMENAPKAYRQIEKFVQSSLNATDSLQELGAQGVVSADLIVAAIMDAEDEINKAFENTAMTFEEAWQMIKNTATKAFEPVSEKLNEMLNSDGGKAAIEGIQKAIVVLAKTVSWIISVLTSFFSWCANNWEWLKYVILGVITVLGVYFGWLAAKAIWAGLEAFWGWLKAWWPLVLIVAAIMAILYVYELWVQGTITTTEAICACLVVIGVVFLIIAAIMTAGIYLIIALVIFAIAAVIYWFSEVCGAVTWFGILCKNIGLEIGGFFKALAWVVANAFMTAVEFVVDIFNGCCSWIGALFKNLGETIKNIATNIGIAFSNAWNGALSTFWNFIASCLEGLDWLAKPIEKIAELFGKSFDYSSFTDSIRNKAANYDAKQQEYVKVNGFEKGWSGDAWTTGVNKWSAPKWKEDSSWSEMQNSVGGFEKGWSKEAYNIGYNWGQGIEDKINDWGSKFQSGDGLFDGLKEKLGLDGALPNPYDPELGLGGAYDPNAIKDSLGNIDDNTKKTADSIALENDDLDYLRKLAEMEWRNEFTTAEIKIDMTNNNTVNGERDLDGIVEYLSDVLRSEMTSVAYGVHY